jgi:serine/threonine-protein kinase
MATTFSCLSCGTDLGPGNRFCPACGAGVLSCAACGKRLLEGEGSCPDCGCPADSPAILDTDASQEPYLGSWAEVVQRLRRATLGEFEIGRELGRGAMAAVFLAHEVSLDRKVAIKVMSPGLLMDEGMAERFKREAITIAHLNHPNIVSVHSVRQAEGLHFFVMRYIQGRALEQVIQRAGRLPIPIVRSILYQVGSALTYAHRSRVVHRDIKPANILIDEDGNAVVTDFGIAKVAEQPSGTHPGALVGTPAYMSPEQCSGAEVSGASDQYALGAVAYEMITGVSPFTGSTLTVMQAHLERPPQPIRERNGDCPPELEAAVLRMLEKDPVARWPSITQANAALGAAPLGEEDPLLAELCRLATPEWGTLAGSPAPATPRARPSSARSATPAGLVRSISILPPPAALETGDSFTLVALLRGERGTPLPGRRVEWATDTPEVLRVDGLRGEATAIAPGSARLTATCEGVRARLQVQVAPPTVDDADVQPASGVVAIQVSAPPKSVKAGDSFVLTATPLDYRGGFLLGHTVQWSTSDVGVAVVTASGWVATLGQGPVVLTATCEGVTASVGITVEEAAPAAKRTRPPPPKPPHFEPVAEERRPPRRRRGSRSRRRRLLTASASILLLAPLLWLYSGFRGRAVPTASRPALTVPTAEVHASQLTPAEPVAAIHRGAPAAVTIERGPRGPLVPGASAFLLAEVRDLAGRTVSGSRVTWSSTNPRVARVDSASGLVHAVRPGRARVVAASGEWRASVPIVVRRPPAEPQPAALGSVDPNESPRVGDTLTLGATDVEGGSDTAASSRPAGLPGDVAVDTLAVQPYESEPSPSEEPGGAAKTPAAKTAAPKTPGVERRRLDAGILAGVQQCYDALRSKDVARMAMLYRPTNKSDKDKLNKLSRILRREEWGAVVGERVDGTRQLGTEAAAMDFSFQLVWKDAFGGRLTSRPVFRAEFAKNGDEWEISSCRIVGSPKL